MPIPLSVSLISPSETCLRDEWIRIMYCISIAYPSAVMSTHAENRVDDRGVSNLQDDGDDEKLLFVYVENNI